MGLILFINLYILILGYWCLCLVCELCCGCCWLKVEVILKLVFKFGFYVCVVMLLFFYEILFVDLKWNWLWWNWCSEYLMRWWFCCELLFELWLLCVWWCFIFVLRFESCKFLVLILMLLLLLFGMFLIYLSWIGLFGCWECG